jgi:hypothetical protein
MENNILKNIKNIILTNAYNQLLYTTKKDSKEEIKFLFVLKKTSKIYKINFSWEKS